MSSLRGGWLSWKRGLRGALVALGMVGVTVIPCVRVGSVQAEHSAPMVSAGGSAQGQVLTVRGVFRVCRHAKTRQLFDLSVHGRFSFYAGAHGLQGVLVDRGNVPKKTVPPVANSIHVIFPVETLKVTLKGRPVPEGYWVIMRGDLGCAEPALTVESWRYAPGTHSADADSVDVKIGLREKF